MKLSRVVYPDMNAARSVNLERDKKDVNIIKDYQVTAKTINILGRFASALQGEKVNAWSLTGPYGMGKSAFINFLMAVTGPANDPQTILAWDKISETAPELQLKLASGIAQTAGDEGLFQVAVTASYEPVNHSLARGLQNALLTAKLASGSEIQRELHTLLKQNVIDTQRLLNIFSTVQNLADRPLLVVVDEFGKNLDFMSHHHNKGDIFILQQLAELGSAYLWVCLHQAFDEYATGLSNIQRREWSKVQGRFEDVTFLESTHQMLYLIKKTLKQNQSNEDQERIKAWAREILPLITESSLADYKEFDEQTIAAIYPMHPITAIALIELCCRFAQNDRTLFSFICSGDRYALPAFLDNTDVTTSGRLPALGLEQVYEYFFNISTTVYINRAESQRWIEIHGIIEEARHLGTLEQGILKTIGVLNILSGTRGMKACFDNISSVIAFSRGVSGEKVKRAINKMIGRGILHYREYAKEYRLWEGSDFDVNEAVRTAKNKLAIGSLDIILEKYLPLMPMIASRHAYNTGTVRRFERRWLNVESLHNELRPKKGYDGLVLYCFGYMPKMESAPKLCADGRPLLIAYGPFQTALTELALEAAAVRTVLTDSQELVYDIVARKEVKYRVKVAEQRFRDSLAQLYAPGSEDLLWYKDGVQITKPITNSKQLSMALSDLCDTIYNECPRIGNEMINYNKLTSAAVRARRELVEAMATNAAEEGLGLKGNGPEVAIYKSLLLEEGLHVKSETTGCWRFSLEGKDKTLAFLWRKIDECINREGNKEGVGVEQIIDVLRAPPFGLRKGPLPIYISLYLLAKSNEIAVFREGTYLPYISAAEMALMVKRPDLFTLKQFVTTNIEREVFDIYKSILKRVNIKNHPGLRNSTMLGVVGPLVKFIDGLPRYSKSTRKISVKARRVRTAIQNSIDPMRLLFEELPHAVGIDMKRGFENDSQCHEEIKKELLNVISELGDAYNTLLYGVEKTLLNLFDCGDLEELHKSQQKRFLRLVEICDDAKLKPIIKAFAREYKDPSRWLRGITGIITRKPTESWNDYDFTIFATKLRDYISQVNQLETLTFESGTIVRENTRLFSVMLPNGKIKRETINISQSNDIEVQKKVDEILKLPDIKIKGVLLALAEKILVGDVNN